MANRVDGAFTAVGASPSLRLEGKFYARLEGSFVGQVVLERSTNETDWTPQAEGVFTRAVVFEGLETRPGGASYRLRCNGHSSGTIYYAFAAAPFAEDFLTSLGGSLRATEPLAQRAGGTSGGATVGLVPGGRIFSLLTATANPIGTTAVERIVSTNIPAGLFNRDGQVARVRAWGTTAGNGNGKKVGLVLGTTSTLSIDVSSNAGFWQIDATMCRTSTDVQEVATFVRVDNTNAGAFAGATASDDASDIPVVVLARGAASDVTVRGLTIEFLP